MAKELTHLNALHAFEAAARLGSFTRAAAELGVTPAAVGQQVRILEAYLGRKLFDRTPAGLRPTAAAAPALGDLQQGFARLEVALSQLRGPAAGNRLAVTAAPALAARWLAPRLQGLYTRVPHIDLRMDTSLGLLEMPGGPFDIAIRYCSEPPEGTRSRRLIPEVILPVCNKALWEAAGAPAGEARLLELPLLHIDAESSDASVPQWRDWGRERSIESARLDEGTRYPHSAMALQAALNGQGVVLCGLILVIDDLLAGRLIAPFGNAGAVRAHFEYHLLEPANRAPSAVQATFTRWLSAEAQATRQEMADFLGRESV